MSVDGRLLGGLEVLDAVVKAGSFVRAADALGLTQPGVSRAVARLEQRVGVRLFDRHPRAVALTDEGRRFHAEVAPLLEGIEQAALSAAGDARAVRGRLRVNVDPFFAMWTLGARLGPFLAAHPLLSLELVVRDGLGDLVRDGFDVAVRFGEPPPSSLQTRRLLQTRVLTCAAPSYLQRRGHPRQPRELASGKHEGLHFRDPSSGHPFAWEFHRGRQRQKVSVPGQLTVNDPATLMAACLAGQGVAQLLELGAAGPLARGELVQLFPAWADERFPLHAFHPSRHLPPAKVRAFLDFIVQAIA